MAQITCRAKRNVAWALRYIRTYTNIQKLLALHVTRHTHIFFLIKPMLLYWAPTKSILKWSKSTIITSWNKKYFTNVGVFKKINLIPNQDFLLEIKKCSLILKHPYPFQIRKITVLWWFQSILLGLGFCYYWQSSIVELF